MGICTRVLSTVAILWLLLDSGGVLPVAAEGGGGIAEARSVPVTVAVNAPDEVEAGSNFTATVDISQVENFDGSNFDISFDPAVLSVENVTNGDISGTIIPVDIWNLRNPGTFTVVQNVPGLAGVNGSGYLAVLHFHVIGSAAQSSNITLSNGMIGNNLALEIPATWVGDSVRVAGVDITPPTVIATSPTTNATNVAIITTIKVIFSETMNTTSAQGVFSILPVVSGNFSWGGKVMTFTPAAYLKFDTTYAVTISTSAQDLAGNPLAKAYVWSFVTAPVDTTPPTVITTSPTGNATHTAVNTAIALTFSEGMDTASAQVAFSILPVVTGTFGWVGNVMTFTPVCNLKSGTTYTVTIGASARDLAGNPLAKAYIWSFGTVPITVKIHAPDEVLAGDNFEAHVDIRLVENFAAASYHVSVDPAVLILDNVTAGLIGIGGTTIPIDYWGVWQNPPGNPVPGTYVITSNVSGSVANGSGSLAYLFFRAIGSSGQSSNITLSNGKLSNNSSMEILATWNGDLVRVVETLTPSPTPVPTPAPSPIPTPIPSPSPLPPPVAITGNATDIAVNSARLNGNLSSLGYATPPNVSFQWGIASGNYTSETSTVSMNAPGAFSTNLTGLSANTTYYFRAKAVGNGVGYGSELSFTTSTEQTVQIALKAGWNMVSLPVVSANTTASSVFPTALVVYGWNPLSKSFYSVTDMEAGKGYWVAMLSDTTANVTGVPVLAWSTNMTAGWNMIGSILPGVDFTRPGDNPDGSVLAFTYWWNPVTKSYIYGTTIEDGKGYWAAALQDCSLTLSFP